ncbi:carbon storage regulator [bacterium]|nr:carbon storage regulator [bacterium]
MLVLSRGEGQVITIGDNIRITIVEVRGGKVRVGIDAPRDVRVMRMELLETPEGSGNG